MTTLITNGRCIPYDPDLVDLAKKLRRNQTAQEKRLWLFLKRLLPRFLRQRPIIYYIADFYCPTKKLVIEIDGNQHLSEFGVGYDNERTKILNGFGIEVYRFTNSEIDNNFEVTCERIEEIVRTTHDTQDVDLD